MNRFSLSLSLNFKNVASTDSSIFPWPLVCNRYRSRTFRFQFVKLDATQFFLAFNLKNFYYAFQTFVILFHIMLTLLEGLTRSLEDITLFSFCELITEGYSFHNQF